MDANPGIRLQILSVKRREHPDVALTMLPANNSIVLVNHLNEVAGSQMHALDELDLLLRPHVLGLKVTLLVLDILLLDVEDL